MPIAIQTLSNVPNKTVTFDFPNEVLSFVVGISYWDFTYGGDDHHIETISLKVNANQPSSKQVTATIIGEFRDDSGNKINGDASKVKVCCIAVITAQNPNIDLVNVNNIASGSQSNAIALPGSSLGLANAFLSGLNLSYGNKDHHVEQVQMSAGLNPSGNQGFITSTAQMSDDSGHNASGYINAGLVAVSVGQTGILGQAVINKQTGSSFSVDFGQTISAACALIQSYKVTYGSDDHHVQTIGGGCSGWKVSGSKVTLNNAQAFISDDSGHNQSDSNSDVSMIVFAVP
ncbi:MAG: hypothetical protein AAGI45_12535 [Cyanobacteria bacterium P01_H01_bin.26]